MAKIVCYNGRNESYYSCTAPTDLICGKKYEVISETDRGGCQTDYKLKGVKGFFNSCWFDEVSNERIFIALTFTIPVVGERCKCYKIDFMNNGRNGQFKLTRRYTSDVEEVIDMGNNIYQVTTRNSLYIMQVSVD